MDPRKFLRRLARDLGLLKNDSTSQKKSEKVSEPVNFQHRVHVAMDEDSGRFVGLPPQWRRVVGKKPDDISSPESARSPQRRNFTQRKREMLDDNALDHTLSRTSTANFTSLAASLETPRSRASVADNQDLIIERLKRELRDYKARNPHGFKESTEDVFLSGENYTARNLSSTSRTQFSPLHERSSNNTFPRFSKNLHEFDEMDEDALFGNERSSRNNGNSAQSSKTLFSPTKNGNGVNGKISALSPTKLNGVRSYENPRIFKRSESDV